LINPSNAEFYPICHLLALLGARHILHVSRIRVNYTEMQGQQNIKKKDQTFVPSNMKSLIVFKNVNVHAYFLLVGKHSGSGQNVTQRRESCMKLCSI